jgi:hypothetical protein
MNLADAQLISQIASTDIGGIALRLGENEPGARTGGLATDGRSGPDRDQHGADYGRAIGSDQIESSRRSRKPGGTVVDRNMRSGCSDQISGDLVLCQVRQIIRQIVSLQIFVRFGRIEKFDKPTSSGCHFIDHCPGGRGGDAHGGAEYEIRTTGALVMHLYRENVSAGNQECGSIYREDTLLKDAFFRHFRRHRLPCHIAIGNAHPSDLLSIEIVDSTIIQHVADRYPRADWVLGELDLLSEVIGGQSTSGIPSERCLDAGIRQCTRLIAKHSWTTLPAAVVIIRLAPCGAQILCLIEILPLGSQLDDRQSGGEIDLRAIDSDTAFRTFGIGTGSSTF